MALFGLKTLSKNQRLVTAQTIAGSWVMGGCTHYSHYYPDYTPITSALNSPPVSTDLPPKARLDGVACLLRWHSSLCHPPVRQCLHVSTRMADEGLCEALELRPAAEPADRARQCSTALGPQASARDGPASHVRGIGLLCCLLALYQFSVDFREAAKLDLRTEFFGTAPRAAALSGYFYAGNVLGVFLTAPVMAGVSDALGRRPVLMLEVVLVAVPNACLWLRFPFWWYLVTDNLLPVSRCVIYAFMADVTRDMSEARTAQCFGLLTGSLSAGSLAGYALHGLLASRLTRDGTFAIAAAASLAAVGLAACVPESLPAYHRRPFRPRDANPGAAFAWLSRGRRSLARYFALYSLARFVQAGRDDFLDLYNARLFRIAGAAYDAYWVFASAVEIGASVALLQALSVLCPDSAVMLCLGLACGAAGAVAYALAPTAPWAYAATALQGCGCIWQPCLMALVAAAVRADEQGAAQGALASAASLVAFGAPVIFGGVFDWASPGAPQAVWGLAIAPMLLAALVALGPLLPCGMAPPHRPTAPGPLRDPPVSATNVGPRCHSTDACGPSRRAPKPSLTRCAMRMPRATAAASRSAMRRSAAGAWVGLSSWGCLGPSMLRLGWFVLLPRASVARDTWHCPTAHCHSIACTLLH